MGLREGYIRFRNYISKGKGELSIWIDALKYYLYLILLFQFVPFLKPYSNLATNPLFMVAFSLFFILVFAVFGWAWDFLQMYHQEQEFQNQRNWFVEEMREVGGAINRIFKK